MSVQGGRAIDDHIQTDGQRYGRADVIDRQLGVCAVAASKDLPNLGLYSASLLFSQLCLYRKRWVDIVNFSNDMIGGRGTFFTADRMFAAAAADIR